jgi:hypothetical protein
MNLLKGLLITVMILGAIGAVGYYFINKYIEDRAVEYVEQDLDDSNIANAREYVDNSPSLKAYISEGADANLEELPFQTAVMKKLSLQELQSIQSKAADGMTEAEAMELADTFEEKLTDEELLALKAIIYKELYE